ncbi:alkaline phosphatase D family protein [Parasphingorhabdus sp.]|jgi:alkaline phosphatase D|uniref:alkaline phosphatase D family protein n=1 Tax=Parasphingorhabdus sp. TaxID=2709688 RepID=UPI003D284F44
MTIEIDRRQMMALGTFGLGALSVPASASLINAKGFTHGVASGEPSQNSVLLWTRFVGSEDSKLIAEIADNAEFTAAKIAGEIEATAERDFTAKIVVEGLNPNQWYFFRFIGPDGSKSMTGRTRTLPQGPTQKFNIGVVGCSNMPFGYFNAYAHAAQNADLDLIIHTGDYLYEYPVGTYPSKEQTLAGRVIDPKHEMVQLADYRLRYAAYRSDPDLQRIHQVLPMIPSWDDHEFANDAYKDGAENHDPSEGDWALRKRVAERVYREWMPVQDMEFGSPRWREYQIGDLATLFFTESRIGGRDKPLDLAAAIKGQSDVTAALSTFRDDVWQDPSHSMLGKVQEMWLADRFGKSKASGTKWQVWSQQCVMGELILPQDAKNWVPDDAPPIAQARVAVGALAAKIGLPINFDSWDGYPQARARSLTAAQQAEADLIVLSGDSHNAWAFDLETQDGAAGVEFAGHSVSSPGFEAYTKGVNPDVVAQAVTETNSQLQWADTQHRGYMTVALTPDKAVSTWHFLDSIRKKSIAMVGSKSQTVLRGANQLQA